LNYKTVVSKLNWTDQNIGGSISEALNAIADGRTHTAIGETLRGYKLQSFSFSPTGDLVSVWAQ